MIGLDYIGASINIEHLGNQPLSGEKYLVKLEMRDVDYYAVRCVEMNYVGLGHNDSLLFRDACGIIWDSSTKSSFWVALFNKYC
jgi:hypothetical protein